MGYVLENVEEAYRQHYRTLCIPRQEDRYNLQAGECVRVGIHPELDKPGELVWVRVETVRGDGRYIGVILQRPATISNLDEGFRLDFTAQNVAEIFIDENDWRWVEGTKLAMVSRLIVEEDAWPGRVLRIPPAMEEYSGWMLLKGEEDGKFMSSFSNFHSFPVSQCLEKVPVLSTIMYFPVGADWVWDAENVEYRPKGKQ